MRALIQRVSEARVTVDGACIGEIGAGLLVFVGLDLNDDLPTGVRLLDKVLAYRVFGDDAGRMNQSVRDVGGGILLVSQFTLSANTRKGLRPSFSSAMAPAEAEALFTELLSDLQSRYSPVAAGRFGAEMQVSLVNDGPVTFLLEMAAAQGSPSR
jgi:D-tyrosyl-tRNA(Tyr) deacylase